jgi:hypothetical protein
MKWGGSREGLRPGPKGAETRDRTKGDDPATRVPRPRGDPRDRSSLALKLIGTGTYSFIFPQGRASRPGPKGTGLDRIGPKGTEGGPLPLPSLTFIVSGSK